MKTSFTFVMFLMGILMATAMVKSVIAGAGEEKGDEDNTDTQSTADTENSSDTDESTSTDDSESSSEGIFDDIRPIDNPPWILSGFTKNEFFQAMEGDENPHCRTSRKYRVCYAKTEDETTLDWKNKRANIAVEMKMHTDGTIEQKWSHGDYSVDLKKQKDGTLEQKWHFEDSILEVHTDLNNEKIDAQWQGPKKPKALNEFKQFIDSWCEYNKFMVEKHNCVIHKTNKSKHGGNSEYAIPAFNKRAVAQMKNEKKCWNTSGFDVCLTKTISKTQLFWKNKEKKITVNMKIFANGDVEQNWTYQGNRAQLKKIQNKRHVNQTWNLDGSKLEQKNFPDGSASWQWFGDEKPLALKKFQEFIDSWCQSNDFFVGQGNCEIYSY